MYDTTGQEHYFYKHDDCATLHRTFREVRLCAGGWVHRDDVDTVRVVISEVRIGGQIPPTAPNG